MFRLKASSHYLVINVSMYKFVHFLDLLRRSVFEILQQTL